MIIKRSLLLSIILFYFIPINGQELTQLAKDFINTLSPELRAKTLFTFDDGERYNMNFVPISRKGPSFHDFSEVQKLAGLNLLQASLSKEGYRKTSEIIELENVLIQIENNQARMADGSPMRDPLNYHFCVFGDLSPDGFWGWKFEGHHISLNFTSTNNQITSSTPSFFGSNPAVVNLPGMEHKEVLKYEAELAFRLVNSFTRDQLAIAKFSDNAPWEIITRNDRKVEKIEPTGLSFGSMTISQQKLFLKLLQVYIDNYKSGFSRSFREKIEEAGRANLAFAWAGSLQPGKGHYYRIQGPMLLIEYDNTQNNANHIHTVVRDLTNDFGEDVLKEHYLTDHKK